MIRAYSVDIVYQVRELRDQYNAITSTQLTEIRCRVAFKRKRIVNSVGEELISEKQIIMLDRDLHEDDKIRIDGRDWKIMKIDRPKDFSWQYIEVYL
jgi:hypothetical protein